MKLSELRACLAMLDPRERWQAFLLAIFAVGGACAEAVSIGAVFPFMALLNNPEMALANPKVRWLFEWSGAPGVERFVLAGALVLLAVFLVKNIFLAALYAFQSRFVCDIEARLATDLLSAYLRAPYVERLERNSADRIRIITGEVGRVTAGVMMPAIALFTEGLVIAGMIALLLFVQPVAALLALALVGAIGALLQTAYRRRLGGYRELRVQTSSAMFRWASEGLGAFKETKVLSREDYFIGEFAANSRAYARATRVFTTMNLLPRLVVETAAVGALLLAVIVTIVTGEPMHEIVPVLTLFGLAAVRIMPSATRILGAVNNLRYYAPAVQTVALDLKLVESLRSRIPRKTPVPATVRREPLAVLELERVSFSYPGSPAASLSAIDLRISRGEAIAVVGKSGSGKTTLADLLLGLLDPLAGTIRINGKKVTSLGAEWQGISGLVPQEFFLRDDSIRRNVAFGISDPRIDDQQVWRALRLARLEERVRGMPQLLDTPVGERGALLSGGERQRLSIARALYNDPEILVLDEATSALDPATEAEFIATLQSLKGQKTIIVITHRVASTAWCDKVFVMSAGRIVAEGPFAELAVHDRAFAELRGISPEAAPGAGR